jgi:hypothetical protein
MQSQNKHDEEITVEKDLLPAAGKESHRSYFQSNPPGRKVCKVYTKEV